MRAKSINHLSSGFYFMPIILILGAIFDKKPNSSQHQLLFKLMFLQVIQSNFSEIFTPGNYIFIYKIQLTLPMNMSLMY